MNNQKLEGLLKGDRVVIQELYDTAFSSVRNYVLKNSGQLTDAEDVFQEALVILFRKGNQKGFELSCELSTYIYAVGRNIWLDRLRRTGKYTTMTIDEGYKDEASDAIEVIHESEKKYLFQKHFSKLADECQKLLKLFFEGKSMKAIMTVMGYRDEVHARKRKFICKEHLVDAIKKDSTFIELFNGT